MNIRSWLNSWKAFVIVDTLLIVVINSFSGYFVSIITALEKQFNLSSSWSGLMLSSRQIGHFVSLIFVSYIGGRWHLPRVLGLAYVITGCMVITMGSTRFILASRDSANVPNSSLESSQQFCTGNHTHSNITEDLNVAAFVIFYLAYVIIGAVSVPMSTLGLAYLEDIIPSHLLPAVLGITSAVGSCGVFIGFFLASWCNSVFVTLADTDLLPEDPSWIGAWWFGFFVIGSLFILVAPLMFLFKKNPPTSGNTRRVSENEGSSYPIEVENDYHESDSDVVTYRREHGGSGIIHGGASAQTETLNNHEDDHIHREVVNSETVNTVNERYALNDLPRALLRVATNPLVMVFLLIKVIGSFNDSGPWNFMLKYFNTQYQVPEWKASLMFGLGGWLTMSISAVTGGLIASKFRLSFTRSVLMCVVCVACIVGVKVSTLFLSCDQASVDGVNASSHVSLMNSCNRPCNCSREVFTPVCDSRLSYFSACHAGCSHLTNLTDGKTDIRVYTNCTCTKSGLAVEGICPVVCPYILAFVVIAVLPTFFGGIANPPATVNILRCVERRDKALALGFIRLMKTLLGALPASSLTGLMIDSTCLVWGDNDVKRGNCWIYDYREYRMRVMGLSLALAVCALVLYYVAYLIARRDPDKRKSPGVKKGNRTKPLPLIPKVDTIPVP